MDPQELVVPELSPNTSPLGKGEGMVKNQPQLPRSTMREIYLGNPVIQCQRRIL